MEDYIYPGNVLTVIIRDDAPMHYANDSPTYRSVQIKLTIEQQAQLRLQKTFTCHNFTIHETISKCFIESEHE
jgi:hypothetical protein